MTALHDTRRCELGEGPLWHPVRRQLFWFDVTGRRLMSSDFEGQQVWQFAEIVSAAGWVDRNRLLIASETALFSFDLISGERQQICALEADIAANRSNDGRADPFGGFWIGTMGKSAEHEAGAIYRWYRGELRRLFDRVTIPNSICFDPQGRFAHFSDSDTRRVMKVTLDAQGWPNAVPQPFLDFTGTISYPDGAVIDATGLLWLAEWGAGRVGAYASDGSFVREVRFDAPQTSCAAFGGPDLETLFCTSAMQGMDAAARAASPQSGMTFAAPGTARGLLEHQVIL